MSRVLVILVLVLLIIPVGVLGVKPVPQVSSSDLTLVYPKAQAFKLGTDFDLYVHIFNSTSGLPFDNTTINCSIHIYNQSDNEQIVTNRFTYVGNYDFEYEASSVYFPVVGFYPYIVWCSNGVVSGFFSDELLISGTGDGWITDFDVFLVFLVVLLPLFVSWLFLKWAGLLGDEHNPFKLFLSFGSLILVLVAGWFIVDGVSRFSVWVSMLDSVSVFVEVFGWLLFVIFGYWLVYLLFKLFKGMMRKKEEKIDYG